MEISKLCQSEKKNNFWLQKGKKGLGGEGIYHGHKLGFDLIHKDN